MIQERTRAIAAFFANTKWQVAISVTLFGATLARSAYQINRTGVNPLDPRQATYVLASIGTVLGLATSVAFGFVIFFVNHANSRKHDLYFKFRAALFEFDTFLKEYPPKIVLVSESLALSWELKVFRMSDFPILDWGERLDKVMTAIEDWNETPNGDPNLSNKVLAYLDHLEEIVSEVGMLCLRQIVAEVHVKTVIKAFVTVGLLLLSLVLSYIVSGQVPTAVITALPVAFATMAALILFEIGWYLRREADEHLDFVKKNEADN